MNGAWHKQLKLPLNKLSLIHRALGSQGVDKHGSGTDGSNQNMKSSKLMFIASYIIIPEQLNPFPSVNGELQIQVKLSESNPSRTQMALTSQGGLGLRQGSGTELINQN